MNNEDIKKTLEIAVNAPSGSNSQPWRFEVRGSEISVIAEPEKDHPILNFKNRGTWLAHGALIENIIIAASSLGYRAQPEIFPDRSRRNVTARIALEEGRVAADPLAAAIPQRTTNRKVYESAPLTPAQKNALMAAGGLHLIEEPEQLKIIGRAVSVNEIVMFENRALHRLFAKEIVWSEKELAERGSGLYLKTMELKPPQEKALKLFKYWPVMNLLNKLGAARGIAKGNAKNYAACGAMLVFTTGERDEDYIQAGRLVERVWLKATQLGLSVHLITGIFFFWQRFKAGLTSEFSSRHIKMIEKAYREVADLILSDNKTISAVLRVGKNGEPTARSPKKPPEIIFD